MKASTLCDKNVHNVPYHTIQRTLKDYEPIVDMDLFLEHCRQDYDKTSKSTANNNNNAHQKKGLFLTNLNEIMNKNDWSFPATRDDNSISSNKMTKSQTAFDFKINHFQEVQEEPARGSSKPEFKLQTQKSMDMSINFMTNNNSEKNDHPLKFKTQEETLIEDTIEWQIETADELSESKQILKTMFPDVAEDLIVEFLGKYENDVNVVTNLFLDSFNFSSISNENCTEIKEPEVKRLYQVKTLQELCLDEMDKLEIAMEELGDKIDSKTTCETDPNKLQCQAQASALEYTEPSANSKLKLLNGFGQQPFSKTAQIDFPTFNYKRSDSVYSSVDFNNEYQDSRSSDSFDQEEPILSLKINKLRSLIEIFGTEDDLEQLNGKYF